MSHFFNHANAIKGILSLMFFICLSHHVISQKKLDQNIEKFYNENVTKNMDTSYVNYEVKNWSLRAFTIFKDHSFLLQNSNT